MNKKQKFMQAVRILAPENNFIIELAHRVRDDDLPSCPGGAALEFVAALLGITGNKCPRRAARRPVYHTRTAFGASTPSHASRVSHHVAKRNAEHTTHLYPVATA